MRTVGSRKIAESPVPKFPSERDGGRVRLINDSAVIERAVEVIGDYADAMRWMGTPVRSLGYATPISLLTSKDGVKSVLAVLSQLEHGVL